MPEMLAALRAAKRPVALTGAGISAPSGLPTFQSRWKGRPVRDFLGRDYFRRDPVGFFALYCEMESWCDAQPNAAHRALAALGMPIITQNIDGLHQKAGSAQVIELHGNLRTLHCPVCGTVVSASTLCAALRPLYAAGDGPAILRALRCPCGAQVDVDVVLYGDAVQGIEAARALVEDCDLLAVVGTSLETYPAAMLPGIAARAGARVLIEDRDCIAALTE
ncbi:NAD-dependent deacetylase [Clostridia bacterium]|nr:NAD-dependent deacetylase [Clostridia bacterium]